MANISECALIDSCEVALVDEKPRGLRGKARLRRTGVAVDSGLVGNGAASSRSSRCAMDHLHAVAAGRLHWPLVALIAIEIAHL